MGSEVIKMDISAVASASIDMHLAQTQQAVGIAMAKDAMDSQEAQMTSLINDMLPSFGHVLDVTV